MNARQQQQLHTLVAGMEPITLAQMKSVQLMNRTDQKYVCDTATFLRLLALAAPQYFVQDIDGKRVATYRTVYWDTPDGHTFYRTHQCGHLPRTKVRVRTYVDSALTFLEVKRKNNHGKTKKKRIAVPSIDDVMANATGDEFLCERTGLHFDGLIPCCGNNFHRITLVNKAKTERLTIDFDLDFDNLETGATRHMENIVIIELKRDGRAFSPILPLMRRLRIKKSGFSKYCIGSSLTNPALPQNRFKKRLRRIAKIAARSQEETALQK